MYRPISNLTFMSKVVERLVCRQLGAFLQHNGLMPELQSAYRRGHTTETAILKVVTDFLLAADSGEVTLLSLSLLDLSAAFDMQSTTTSSSTDCTIHLVFAMW